MLCRRSSSKKWYTVSAAQAVGAICTLSAMVGVVVGYSVGFPGGVMAGATVASTMATLATLLRGDSPDRDMLGQDGDSSSGGLARGTDEHRG